MKFKAEIYKIGINPVVDPPDSVLEAVFDQAGKSKGSIPVCGVLNGAPFTQTLVRFAGEWRLYINGEMLSASGLKVGDVANIEIEYDPRPRDVAMPAELADALQKDKLARLAFEKLNPSRKKEISRYIGSLKSAEARARNVERVLKQLRA